MSGIFIRYQVFLSFYHMTQTCLWQGEGYHTRYIILSTRTTPRLPSSTLDVIQTVLNTDTFLSKLGT